MDYPIPGNDDAMRAISLYCELAQGAILDGLQAEMVAGGGDVGSAAEAPVEPVLAQEAPAEAATEEAPAEAATEEAPAEAATEEAPAEAAAEAPAEKPQPKKPQPKSSLLHNSRATIIRVYRHRNNHGR